MSTQDSQVLQPVNAEALEKELWGTTLYQMTTRQHNNRSHSLLTHSSSTKQNENKYLGFYEVADNFIIEEINGCPRYTFLYILFLCE